MFGNYMNADGRNGGAPGFRIASVAKLTDTKSADNQMTLLHFIAQTVAAKIPEAVTLKEQLADCEAPCKRTNIKRRTHAHRCAHSLLLPVCLHKSLCLSVLGPDDGMRVWVGGSDVHGSASGRGWSS
jgi:hypothetical protein